jgi:hypothetical protein
MNLLNKGQSLKNCHHMSHGRSYILVVLTKEVPTSHCQRCEVVNSALNLDIQNQTVDTSGSGTSTVRCLNSYNCVARMEVMSES